MARAGLDEAVTRLDRALDALEAAFERRRAADEQIADIEEEMHLLALDRARLARELDDLKARSVELETVNREVSRRIDSAMESVRTVLVESGT
jgi:chromosome segregation ATPase